MKEPHLAGAEFARGMQLDSNGGHVEPPKNKIAAWAQGAKALR